MHEDELVFVLELEPLAGPVEFVPGGVEVSDSEGSPLRLREVRMAGRALSPTSTVSLEGLRAFHFTFELEDQPEEWTFTIDANCRE